MAVISKTRNFSIIAHIDHGKSTLADRILDVTNAVTERQRQEQILDDMELERERGITIKSRSVSLAYKARNGEDYRFNLIDTPGHVDFHYEVSRSLAACEGAILVVDAAQGVQAQTLSHVYTAIGADLEVITALNKIDLPQADPEMVKQQIEEIIGLDTTNAVAVSGKTGDGVVDLLERVIQDIPAPEGDPDAPLKALLFDSWFDSYRGVIVQIRVIDGTIKVGSKVKFMQTRAEYEVTDLGRFSPFRESVKSLSSGDVGYMAASIKEITDAKIGDTVTEVKRPATTALPGFQIVKPMVFSGLYPEDSSEFEDLRDALNKLKLNDSALEFEPETSQALGFGFRCGYLGLLHMEIVQERLEREFDLRIITTAPSVLYQIITSKGEELWVDNPANFPEQGMIERILEPVIIGTIHVTKDYLGAILTLCEEKRGRQKSIDFHAGNQVKVCYYLPLNEIVLDFYDKLKSVSRGYASFDYEPQGWEESKLVKLDLRINGEIVDALSMIVHSDHARSKGIALAETMQKLIDRQMFDIAIQAAVGNKIIARTNVKALRKNVTAKCYGGDITRKRKLLEKQKAGKKRMKNVGSVSISQDAFLAALKLDK